MPTQRQERAGHRAISSPSRRQRAGTAQDCRPGLHCPPAPPAPPAPPRAWACERMRLTQRLAQRLTQRLAQRLTQVVPGRAACIADSTNHTPAGPQEDTDRPTRTQTRTRVQSGRPARRRHAQVPPRCRLRRGRTFSGRGGGCAWWLRLWRRPGSCLCLRARSAAQWCSVQRCNACDCPRCMNSRCLEVPALPQCVKLALSASARAA